MSSGAGTERSPVSRWASRCCRTWRSSWSRRFRSRWCRRRRTSRCWSSWRSPPSDCDHRRPTANRTVAAPDSYALGMDTEIDWPALRQAAVGAMRRAYAPYSNFPVGAAALVDDGRLITGCNVENASYGLGLCAECGLVSALHASGGGRLVAMACVDVNGAPLMPCGRCRQLLWEHGGPDCLIDHVDGPEPMASLLPYAFDDNDLGRAPRVPKPSTAVPA